MRRIHLGWLAVGSLAYACSSNDDVPKPIGGGAEGGEGASAGQGATSSGGSDAGQGSIVEGGAGQGGASVSALGGAEQLGGAPPGGVAGGEADAGEGPLGMAGEGGAGTPVLPPDLITSSGGPWPDSFSAYCAEPTKVIVCPQTDAAFFGQDGTYRINVPSYSTTATTLTDSVTGLMWQRSPDATGKLHADALSYCDALDLGGHTDWRLPSRLEYISILDEGFQNGCAMPPGFSLITTGPQWTASPTGSTAGAFFLVNDGYGMWTVASDSASPTARCVRGAALTGTLQVGTDTTVDTMTSLEWQTSMLDDTARDWQAALAYCQALVHASKDDWRLPSIKELATIVDEAAATLAVDPTKFGSSTAAHYWSSTPAQSFGSERYALALETGIGISPSFKMTETAAARCVRSAAE